MKFSGVSFSTAAGLAVVLVGATAFAQSAKPSPYTGVSHPPNDAIVTNDLNSNPPAANPAKAAPANSDGITVSRPTAQMEAPPTSPEDQDYVRHPGLMSRPADVSAAPAADSDPGDEIVTSLPAGPNQLPPGTTLTVALDQQLSTASTPVGSIFSGRLIDPVLKNGHIVIPVGSTVTGRVTSVYAGRRITGGAAIHLRPDEVVLPNGKRYFLHAEVYDIGKFSNVKPNEEGDLTSVDHGKRAVAEAGLFGGGAAAAGVLIAGGPAGLIAGGAAAGYVGAHWLLSSHQAVLPKNAEIVFGLTQPMSLVSFHE